ncbi:MAG TPA: YbfB/YjiJ family MFS transporter [Alphaproteobacteria bacterium]|jgi:predicted MFS family arabinose efflux permease
MSTMTRTDTDTRYALFAGLCATFVGIGLARFSYAPLIPALVGAHWLTPGAAAYLGATNFAGYLLGSWSSQVVGRKVGIRFALRMAMLLTGLSFLACAWPLSELWLSVWRFIAGFTGGLLMVLAAPGILARLPAARRGLAGGVIFTGIGLGIAIAGGLLPLLLRFGLREVWLTFGGLTLLLTLLSWGGWQEGAPAADAATPPAAPPREARKALRTLYVEYGLNAFGLVPHFVFFVDFVARGLDRGLSAGAGLWVVFGLGACLGPLAAGSLADRIGFRDALRLSYALQLIAVLLPLVYVGNAGLALSALIAGASVPGVVTLALGRTQELLSDDGARRKAWRNCSVIFAIAQAGGAYLLSYVFAQTHDYAILFAFGAVALAVGLLLDLVMLRGRERPAPSQA